MKTVTAILSLLASTAVAKEEWRMPLKNRLNHVRGSAGANAVGHSNAMATHSRRQLADAAVVPSMTFYVPVPELILRDECFKNMYAGTKGRIKNTVAFSINTAGTILFWDNGEDGYEEDPVNPTSSTTLIFGDGDKSNGYLEAYPDDVFQPGNSLIFEMWVDPKRDPLDSPEDYSAGDKITSTYPVTMVRGAYAETPGSVLAGAVEVFDTGYWGKHFLVPIGQNTQSFTQAFEFVGLFLQAGEDDTMLTLPDGSTMMLQEGETHFMIVEEMGIKFDADKLIQAHIIAGDRGDYYEVRWFALKPFESWDNDYLSPVGDYSIETKVLVFNPSAEPITVNYRYSDKGAPQQDSLTVPPLDVAWTDHIWNSSSCHLSSEETFIAFGIADTWNRTDLYTAYGLDQLKDHAGGEIFDWGFPVMATKELTSTVLIAWGYGCTNNNCDGNRIRSMVYIAPFIEEGTFADLYCDFDNDGEVDDDNGGIYTNVAFDQARTFVHDLDTDMSGSVCWGTVAGTGPDGDPVPIAAAWGQNPSVANGAGEAYSLDMGTVVVPFSTISAAKTATLDCQGCIDLNNDGYIGVGDTYQYEITVANVGHRNIGEGFLTITDDLDPHVDYVTGSTKYTDHTGKVYNIADDASDPDKTAFPLDGDGIDSEAVLKADPSKPHKVTFRVTVQTGDHMTNVAMLKNNGYATAGREKTPFSNWIRLSGDGRNADLSDMNRPTPSPTLAPTSVDEEECPEEL